MYKNWNGMVADNIQFSSDKPVVMAGPCLLESYELGLQVGQFLKDRCAHYGLPYVFKTSYDKANRLSAGSPRGPGNAQAFAWLSQLKQELGVPFLVDIHEASEAQEAAQIADILQIPAFLCQQPHLLAAAAATGKVVQVKKGQWLSGEDAVQVGDFLQDTCGHARVTLVERGSLFGYNNLVVDYRNLVSMRAGGYAVVFDATHAVQLPGAGQGVTLGLRSQVLPLTRAALAVGIDGLFLEVHSNPDKALSDAATQLPFDMAEDILRAVADLSQRLR